MKLYRFEWGLVIAFVIAESREEALKKVRAEGSVARERYSDTVDFDREPVYSEESDDMIMHFGWD